MAGAQAHGALGSWFWLSLYALLLTGLLTDFIMVVLHPWVSWMQYVFPTFDAHHACPLEQISRPFKGASWLRPDRLTRHACSSFL